jgi:hypothetical protein
MLSALLQRWDASVEKKERISFYLKAVRQLSKKSPWALLPVSPTLQTGQAVVRAED